MSDAVLVGSDRCGLDDLFLGYGTEAERGRLSLGPGWPRRWTGTWRISGGEVACAVRDLGEVPVAGCVPVRRFTWRQRQRHRPGLQFMVSTGRLHGFESLEERSLLLALDFTGTVEEVLSQPFRLKFETAGGDSGEHIPDFWLYFVTGLGGCWTSAPPGSSRTRTRSVAPRLPRRRWRRGGGTRWWPAGARMSCRCWTRCRPSGGSWMTGWVCVTPSDRCHRGCALSWTSVAGSQR